MPATFSIDVNRPIEEVFAYAADMARLAEWGEGILAVSLESGDSLGVGRKFTVKATAMGRTMEIPNEVIAFKENKVFAFQTSGSMPYVSHRTFESNAETTTITEQLTGAHQGLFAFILNPLTLRFIKRIHYKSLLQLKQKMEKQVRPL